MDTIVISEVDALICLLLLVVALLVYASIQLYTTHQLMLQKLQNDIEYLKFPMFTSANIKITKEEHSDDECEENNDNLSDNVSPNGDNSTQGTPGVQKSGLTKGDADKAS